MLLTQHSHYILFGCIIYVNIFDSYFCPHFYVMSIVLRLHFVLASVLLLFFFRSMYSFFPLHFEEKNK